MTPRLRGYLPPGQRPRPRRAGSRVTRSGPPPSTSSTSGSAGGRSTASARRADLVHSFEGRYLDIVPDQRIVFAYDMHLDDTRISVSLATVELKPSRAPARG